MRRRARFRSTRSSSRSSSEKGLTAGRTGRQADADPPRHVRPDRPAADAGGGRRVPRGRLARAPSRRWSIGCWPRPHYGERWGRHWLDVARYAEDQAPHLRATALPATPAATATGSSHAFNADMPYDRFVDRADRRRPARRRPSRTAQQLGGTGFLGAGAEVLQGRRARADVADERGRPRSTRSARGFLGLTVALRPLPRPQVRPDPDARLLLPGRRLRQHRA